MMGILLAIALAASHPVMPDTVKEYANIAPQMPETVEEYMERGRRWAEYIESLNHPAITIPAVYETQEEAPEEAPEETVPETNPDGMIFYSRMELTAYIWTGNPCADGVFPETGITVACNDSALWHRWIYIDGIGARYVHDTGGMGCGVIDVYVGDYDSAVNFGRQSADVYILE